MGRPRSPVPPDAVFLVADLFFAGKKAQEIADTVNKQFPGLPVPLTRESVYAHLVRARELHMVQLVPPPEDELRKRVATRFGVRQEDLHVVTTANTLRTKTASGVRDGTEGRHQGAH